MSTTSPTLPYEWLKEIPTALLQLDDIPLLGHPPHFPWEEFSKKLAAAFKIHDLKIQPTELQWRPAEDLLSGLGGKPYPIHIAIPGVEGDLCWIFSERDIHLLMALLVTNKKEPLDIIDPDFEKGFVHFLIYEIFQIFSETNVDKTVAPHLVEKEDFPNEASLCRDVSFSVGDQNFIGRLILSPKFRTSWKEKYASRSLDIPLPKELAEKIQIPVHIEAGRTTLTLGEWKKIQPGDFLLLEHCSIDPNEEVRRIMLTVNGIPFFRAKIKDRNIKILEHPLYHEAETTMPKQPDEPSHFEFEEETENEQFDFDEISIDDSLPGHENPEAVKDPKAPAAPGPKAPTPPPAGQPQAAAAAPKTPAMPKTGAQPQAPAAPAPAEERKLPLSPDEIPLSIVIEVGRLQMSIQKIMDIQPGNVLELDVRPENGVDLVVNGKRIGKGELVRLGEVLGVRILDIG